jgi:hypothetical protein
MKVAYLKGLETATADNRQLKKAVGTFCVLKALNKSGFVGIANYSEAAAQLNITSRTLYTRIKQMEAAGLITTTGGQGVFLKSWEDVADLFDIAELKYSYVKGTERPDLVLSALFIRSRQRVCESAFLFKVNKDVELKNYLVKVTGLQTSEKGFAAAVLKQQLLATLINNKAALINLNANTTPGYKNLSKKLGYNSRGGLAYLKRILQKADLLTTEKREFTTAPAVYSALIGNVYYRRPLQQRRLTLTDTYNF